MLRHVRESSLHKVQQTLADVIFWNFPAPPTRSGMLKNFSMNSCAEGRGAGEVPAGCGPKGSAEFLVNLEVALAKSSRK